MRLLVFVVLWAALPSGIFGQDAAPPSGSAERGRDLFLTYKCYACHGYGGETGTPRLVPMARSQGSFIAFLRSPTGAMPAYVDVSEDRLADVYAYIRSIEPDAPPVEEIPLLEELLEQVQ